MANPHHVELLRDVDGWNSWRRECFDERPDLSGADLAEADLSGADLSWANLDRTSFIDTDLSEASLAQADLAGANLADADLTETNLSGADLTEANLAHARMYRADLYGASARHANLRRAHALKAYLTRADLSSANLSEANLGGAHLFQTRLDQADLTAADLTAADLTGANLTGANLTRADLSRATLVFTVLDNAHLDSAKVHGTSVWDVHGEPATQSDLVITPRGGIEVTVDNLRVAQFIYLMLNNDAIRDVIDTITSKAVLILGRFTPERKPVIDAVRTQLRERYNYSPIVFDFEKPASKTIADTVKLLANMARFVVVDLTDATSANFEVGMITNLGLRRLPISFMIERGHPSMAMLATDVLDYAEVVCPVHEYDDIADLVDTLVEGVLDPAESLWQVLNPPPAGA